MASYGPMSGLIIIDGCKVLNGQMPLPWQKFSFESMLDTEFDHDKIIKNIALRTISCSPKILNEHASLKLYGRNYLEKYL